MKIHDRLSARAKNLLMDLDVQSKRTRYIIVSLLVLGALSFLTNLNEKLPGGNLARADVRLMNIALAKFSQHEGGDQSKYPISEQYLKKDVEELNYIRRLQVLSLEGINVPIIGVKISAANAGLIAAMFGFALYGWLVFSIEKEQTTVAHVLFPLIAEPNHDVAKTLWGDGGDDLQEVIISYRKEACRIREAVSSNFLFIYADDRPPRFERAAMVMVLMPSLVLVAHLFADIYWDFYKSFPESGQHLSYSGELDNQRHLLRDLVVGLPMIKSLTEDTDGSFNSSVCGGDCSTVDPTLFAERLLELKAFPASRNQESKEIITAATAILILGRHKSYIIGIRIFQAGFAALVLILSVMVLRKMRETSRLLTLSYSNIDEFDHSVILEKLDVPNLRRGQASA